MAFTYKTSIMISVPVSEVWKVLTDVSVISQFYFGIDWKTDWQKGSKIVFSGEWDHQYFEDKGNILDIEKERFILFNYWNPDWKKDDIPENYTVMRFELEAKDKATIFTVYEYGFKSEKEFETVTTKWKSMCNSLKAIAEKL